jgi:hypothetical protein
VVDHVISDGARTTLFNKGLVCCDVNQKKKQKNKHCPKIVKRIYLVEFPINIVGKITSEIGVPWLRWTNQINNSEEYFSYIRDENKLQTIPPLDNFYSCLPVA